LICAPKVGGSVSRIWRDTRFAKDKTLFRDHAWCMFIRQKNAGLPEFFFVIMPDEFFYGTGYYSAGAASMESMRKLILAGNPDFKAALEVCERHPAFELEGDLYKRSRHPDCSDQLKNWLDRKTICVMKRSTDFGLLFSEQLPETVAKDFRAMAPVYRFLIQAEENIVKK